MERKYCGQACRRSGRQRLTALVKAKGGINFRYSAAKRLEMGVEVLEGLEKVPNNATALGIEQLIIDLNGGAGSDLMANKIPATVQKIYIDTGRQWLEANIPNWKTVFKFQ